MDLDHVAIATTDIDTMLDSLVGELGGTITAGGDGTGFRWMQTRLGNATTGMTVESLVVWRPEDNDFLDRFLARSGPGLHHVTFKVPDIEAALTRVRAAGIEPASVNLADPQWREAFLMPRDAHGTVVQLAQTDDPHTPADALAYVEAHGPDGHPFWWTTPERPAAPATTLVAVVLGSPDPPAAVAFFGDLLGGEVETTDAAGTVLVWPGGGRIRIESAARAGVLRLDATGTAARTVSVSGVPVQVR